MKIAIDTGAIKSGHGVRGIGVYASELIAALDKKVTPVDFAKVDLSKYDIAHIPYFNLFSPNPYIGKAKKTVITIHDVIPLLYKEHYPPGIKGAFYLLFNKIILKKVAAIITDTEVSKRDIVKYLNIKPEKIYVTHLGVKKAFKVVKPSNIFNLPNKFVFYFGDVNYNKNIPTLVKSCKKLKVHLVIAGKQAKEIESLDLSHPELKHLRDIDWSGVTRLGFVSDEEANMIYNLASVYVQPSYYEGFGLSVIHSFAAGCSVVAAETPALVEIGKGACLFADPNDPNDLAEKINKVITDKTLRNQLIETGKVLVKNFNWDKTAKETLDVYQNC